jgi:very-short-patch-repair endonuclease
LRHGPFTLDDALRAGVTRNALQSAPWRRIFREVWVWDELPDCREQRLAAARLVLPPRAVAVGLTAAWLHGVDVRRPDDFDIHVGFPKGQRIRPRTHLVVSQETLAESDIVELNGLKVTSPVRTTFDCMRLLRGDARLGVADAMTHARLHTVEELRTYFAGQRRLRNLRVAELLVDDIEPKADSPMETRLRLAVVEGGNPRPQAQVHVFDRAGDYIGRSDLGYEELRIAIEYDGALHWLQRREDDRRRQRMREAGWIVLVFSADDVYGAPHEVAAAVRRARRQRTAA